MFSPRLAFIGSPRTASPWLLQAVARVGTFEAVCDADAERDVARYHARWAFSDAAAMLREAPPDGVVLEKPPAERADLIKACLAAGVSVLLTGVPGSAGNCKRSDTLARLAGRVVLAAPAIQFAPAVALAKRLLDSGKFGSSLSLEIRSSRRSSTWAAKGGAECVPVDQVYEAVSLVHQLVGPIQRVYAAGHADGAMAGCAVTEAGPVVSLVLHAVGPAEFAGICLEMRSADGSVLRLDQNCRLLCGNGARMDAVHGCSLAAADPAIELGYEGLLAEFRRRLEGRLTSPGLLGGVSSAVAATEAVLASVARGRPTVPRYAGRLKQGVDQHEE